MTLTRTLWSIFTKTASLRYPWRHNSRSHGGSCSCEPDLASTPVRYSSRRGVTRCLSLDSFNAFHKYIGRSRRRLWCNYWLYPVQWKWDRWCGLPFSPPSWLGKPSCNSDGKAQWRNKKELQGFGSSEKHFHTLLLFSCEYLQCRFPKQEKPRKSRFKTFVMPKQEIKESISGALLDLSTDPYFM